MKLDYYITAVPGLAGVVADELSERSREPVRVHAQGRVRNFELLKAEWPGDLQRLLETRTTEDVFVALGHMPLSGGASDARAVANAAWWKQSLRPALEQWSRATGRPLVKRLVWRVVVQADDVSWRQYRRQDLTLAAERGLMNAGASWRLNRDEAPLELWLWQTGRQLLAGLRLTTNEDRQHGGRAVERAAALRPSVAAAMVHLCQPEPDDVFLDPMCGSGTILLERAVAGRYKLLLGGDSDAAAVATALANFGPRHQPREIQRWDARRLPLEDDAVTRLVTNLPWGRQIGEKAEMPALYADLLPEFARVLAPGGRMVLLTSEWETLKGVLRDQPGLKLERTLHDIEILGRRADMFVLERR